MSTAAQQRANKQNAEHSTGPRTGAGKQRSSMNALKHGFRAKDPLIPGESRDDFYEHAAEIEVHFRPANAFEENLVEQIIDVTWRLQRCGRLESALIAELVENAAEQPENQHLRGEQLLGRALARDSGLAVLNRLDRHQSTLARHYNSAVKLLQDARKRRARSLLFHGVYSGPRPKSEARPPTEAAAETNAAADSVRDTGGKSEMTDLTQSVATLLESIAPMHNKNGEPASSDLTDAEFCQTYPQKRGQEATPEAAR